MFTCFKRQVKLDIMKDEHADRIFILPMSKPSHLSTIITASPSFNAIKKNLKTKYLLLSKTLVWSKLKKVQSSGELIEYDWSHNSLGNCTSAEDVKLSTWVGLGDKNHHFTHTYTRRACQRKPFKCLLMHFWWLS